MRLAAAKRRSKIQEISPVISRYQGKEPNGAASRMMRVWRQHPLTLPSPPFSLLLALQRKGGEGKTQRAAYAAIMRSTSCTISRRWKGFDRTLACLGALDEGWSATAAKPVMNMILRAWSI